MKLIPNWGEVVTHAWSVRLIFATIFLDGLEFALPFLQGVLPVSPGTFAILGFFTTIAAGVARFVAQPKTIKGD